VKILLKMENTKTQNEPERSIIMIKYKEGIPIEEQNEQIKNMIEQYFKSRNMTMTEVNIKNEQTSGK
jgi:type III secretory pathway lipoprotein EscJ